MSEIFRVGHLEVESPWGNAGGVVKSPDEVEIMAHTGVGWIEAGSYTLEPRDGNGPNGETVYYYDDATGETFNSLGMPNKGMDEVSRQIPNMAKTAHFFGKKLVVNVAPVSDEPANESCELVDRAYSYGADAVLLNAGCPNVIKEDGGHHEILSHNAKALGEVLVSLESVVQERKKPIFLRTSPVGNFPQARSILRSMKQNVVSAIFTPNTWPGHVPTDEKGQNILEVPGGEGGKSGPAMADAAFKQTAWALAAVKIGGRKTDVVSSSGVTTGRELARRLMLGAVAGAGTTLYYESAAKGYTWHEATEKLLFELSEI